MVLKIISGVVIHIQDSGSVCQYQDKKIRIQLNSKIIMMVVVVIIIIITTNNDTNSNNNNNDDNNNEIDKEKNN